MTATTSYGTVANYTDALTVEDMVSMSITQDVEDFDLPAIAVDWRDAVNTALSGSGISLAGDEFYGPYPTREDAQELIQSAIASIDFWTIVERHDVSVLVTLNAYEGDNIWEDVIYSLDYDEDATKAVDAQDGRDVVIGGVHYHYEQSSSSWRIAS